MLYTGTSGFSYDDWRGRWYPPSLARNRYFDYYAERFNAVEINSTFYHIYSPRMMESLVARAAGRVTFAVKMSELVTHHGMLERKIILSYLAGIEPAIREGVLGAILLQFPQRFHFTRDNLNYLNDILRELRGLPVVTEIRHQSWQCADAVRFFADNRLNLCLMDMPRLRGLPRQDFGLTGDIAYVRFHGRNAYQWWRGEYPGARYDYYYTDAELAGWVEPVEEIQRQAQTAFVFFNNHVAGKAPKNAETFMAYFNQHPGKPSYQDMLSEVY